MSDTMASLRRVHIFHRLNDHELVLIASLCKIWHICGNQVIFREGDDGEDLFIIQKGSVRISLNTRNPDGTLTPGIINMLYASQSFGEMVLLDGVTRSATVVSTEACTLLVIKAFDFGQLCDANPRIGYIVMHNLACDVAYKLRSSNLLLRGNIRWQQGELGRRSS
ncbi:MAG: cyclic nucleotide-binding domain-containing protein [Chloroflexaceae bacterium]|nr:cyclic nucleotide-binding domain-containing protein [Chloroflexaceae bacterium]